MIRILVFASMLCASLDGRVFQPIGTVFQAVKGVWIGAKAGFFALNPNIMKSKGYADFDWFRID